MVSNAPFEIARLATIALCFVAPLHAGVIETEDSAMWFKMVGKVTTLDFTGFAFATPLTDQYATFGAMFPDGNDVILGPGHRPLDGWSLSSNQTITLQFAFPQHWVAAGYPGELKIELFRQGRLIYTSSDFSASGTGENSFAGLISTDPFDAAVFSRWKITYFVSVNDVFFGPGLPGPGDANADGTVDARDLVEVILHWGECANPPQYCPGDANQDGAVDSADLEMVVANWSAKP